jgi:glycosyltransferase involved in cell wall biosynthesis
MNQKPAEVEADVEAQAKPAIAKIKPRYSILLLRPDATPPGGVVNYYRSVLHLISSEFAVRSLIVGRRRGLLSSKLLYPVRFLLDSIILASLLLTKKFDVVHFNPSLNAAAFYRDLIFMAIASTLSSAKLLVFFRGWDDDFYEKLLASPLRLRCLKWFCLRADRVLVLASTIRAELVDIGVPVDRVSVTHTTFDGDLIRKAEGASGDDRFTFLFMSRLIRQKGIAELIHAAAILRDKGFSFRLVLAGSGPFATEAKEAVLSAGLTEFVELPGYLQGIEKGNALMRADAFVFPTYHGEGCPNCILEAMAAGLPIISTTVGGIPDVMQPPAGGVLLDSVSADAVADAMQRFLENPDECARLALENERLAWSKFEANSVARYLESVYQSL